MKRDDRLTEELQFHLEQLIRKLERQGLSSEEARRQALIQFGGVEPAREAARDAQRGVVLRELVRDLRLSLRAMRRTPGFAVGAVLTFALGVTAAVAMFSVFEGVLLRPLPYPESDRLVQVYQLNSGVRNRVADPNYADWKASAKAFAAMADYSEWGQVPIVSGNEAQLASMTRVGEEFFEVMGVRPARGRVIRPDEQRVGAPLVAVVSDTFWRRWRGDADPNGETIRIGDDHYTVVGVMPDGFSFPDGTSVWTARGTLPVNPSRTSHNALVIARLAESASVAQAHAEISAVSRRLKAQHGDRTWMTDAEVVRLLDVTTQASRPVIQLLFLAAVVLLLVATTNLSNLLVVRASGRRAEFALQLALGATPQRLGRQILAESLAICLLGAGVGIGGAVLAVRLFVAAGPASVARLDEVAVSWPAALFAVTVAIGAAVCVTVFTVMGSRSTEVVTSLAEQGRSGGGGRRQARVREGLIVAQVALTLVLLSAAALLGRSLVGVMSVDPGFSLDDGLIVEAVMPGDGSAPAMARQVAFHDEVTERLRRQPGVTHVGLVSAFPLGVRSLRNGTFLEMTSANEITTFEGFDRNAEQYKDRFGSAEYRHVSGEYFEALEIPLLEGRLIDDRDGPGAPHVAVVSKTLAERQWPGRSALGRWIQFGNMDGDLRGIQIVGVVGDVREVSLESNLRPMLYVSARQRPRQAGRAWWIVKGPASPELSDTARRIVREVNPEVPVTMTTMQQAFDATLAGRTFTLWLVGAFGIAALLLAVVGVYGLMSYVVSQRTREMGIRLALGAQPHWLVGLIVRRGLVLAAVGVVAGLAASRLSSNLLDGLLFQVTPDDMRTLAIAAMVMLSAALLATYLPARRLLRQSPARTLRQV
ncbi:MAG: ABC transporter permease [Acidimicrobiia bacterium]